MKTKQSPATLTLFNISSVSSRAVMTYLINKYGQDASLYPADPQQRGTIDQRLYFDIGTLYESIGKCVVSGLSETVPIYIEHWHDNLNDVQN